LALHGRAASRIVRAGREREQSTTPRCNVTEEQTNVNKAFETYFETLLSPTTLEKVAARYGEETAATVKAVYDDALNAPVDWHIVRSIDAALPILHAMLSDKYPWLSEKARRTLNYAFIMAWK
jgi:hypothetical protein